MNPQTSQTTLLNYVQSLLVGVLIYALQAAGDYLSGSQTFTWRGLATAIVAALLSYITSVQFGNLLVKAWAVLQPQTAPTINVHLPEQPTSTTVNVNPAPPVDTPPVVDSTVPPAADGEVH